MVSLFCWCSLPEGRPPQLILIRWDTEQEFWTHTEGPQALGGLTMLWKARAVSGPPGPHQGSTTSWLCIMKAGVE